MNTATLPQSARLSVIIRTVIRLSIPAILAEISAIIMQYIDSAMVGSLGEGASASIGLISSTTWLLGGLCIALGTGFSVQIAQYVGANDPLNARNVFRQALIVTSIMALAMCGITLLLSGPLPRLLGGDPEILRDASLYLFVYALSLPLSQLRHTASSALQCSGNMKTPGALHILLCVLNVIFNFFLIFPTRQIPLPFCSIALWMPGAGLGVLGAALASLLADAVTTALMLLSAFRSPILSIKAEGSWRIRSACMKTAMRIALPAALEHTIMCSAYVAATRITAPLGKVELAANSLAVTAESFCYMPGYGIGAASLTMVGQALGAKRKDLAKRYAYACIIMGVLFMSLLAVAMYFLAPYMMAMLTPSPTVRSLGAQVLRIVVFTEPFYALSIVCADVLRAAGDTAVPGLINLICMWGVRITLSLLLVSRFSLHGIWYAMCTDILVRGILFLLRTLRGKWLDRKVI